MILTVCPNPCIDKTFYIKDFKAGKLNRVDNKIESFGGKAINVAVAVKRLGYDSYSTGFMFEDGALKYYAKLNLEGVPYSYTMCEGAVRINNKVISLSDMILTEINERGTHVGYDKQFELIEEVRTLSKSANIAVFSGSLPLGLNDDFYYRAGQVIDKNCLIVVDAEGEKLLSALPLKPALIKPNLYELENTTGCKADTINEILSACDILIQKGAKRVLLSKGSEGAIIYDGKNAFFAKAPVVEVKGLVGAGDSMVAAACVAIENDWCLEAIAKSAVAAGTAAVLCEGTNLLTKNGYEEIFPLVETQKIK